MTSEPRTEGTSAPAVPATALQHCQFHGVTLDAIQEGGKVWVGIRAVCTALGLNNAGQQQRIERQGWGQGSVCVMHTVAADRKRRAVACIDLEALPMWLATIEVARVKPQLRERLVLFQREAARALRDHFLGYPSAKPVEEPQPRPAGFGDPEKATLHLLELGGRFLWIAAEIGTALGYEPGDFVKRIRREWRGGLVEGQQYFVLTGDALVAAKNEATLVYGPGVMNPKATHIVMLGGTGIGRVCKLCNRPEGQRLYARIFPGLAASKPMPPPRPPAPAPATPRKALPAAPPAAGDPLDRAIARFRPEQRAKLATWLDLSAELFSKS